MPALGTERYEITHKRSAQAINAPCPHSLLFGPLSAVVVSAGKTPDVETKADENGTDCAETEQTPRKAKIVNDKREHDIVEPTKKNKSSKKNVNLIKKKQGYKKNYGYKVYKISSCRPSYSGYNIPVFEIPD